jgi:hypothetical protein
MKFDIPADKAKHAILGAFIGLLAALMFQAVGLVEYWRHAAISAALVAGIVKEVWDWAENRKSTKAGRIPTRGVERADAFATLCGGLLIAGVPNAS